MSVLCLPKGESMIKFKIICPLLFVLLLLPSFASASSILGAAGEYNVFTFGDMNVTSDTEGRVAVGGNFTASDYSVGVLAPQSSYSLVTGGDVDYIRGSINNGGIYSQGDVSLNNYTVFGDIHANGSVSYGPGGGTVTGGVIQNNSGLVSPVNFAAEESYLKSLSAELSQQSTSLGAELKYGANMYLTGDGTTALQVFHLDGAELLSATSLMLNDIAEGASLLLNISGDVSGLTNMGLSALTAFGDKVLFNFYDADILTLAGVGVWGSILAPHAAVSFNSGQINGTVIADYLTGSGQYNYNPYVGDGLGSTPVPEPGTLVLFSIGILGAYGVLRRRAANL